VMNDTQTSGWRQSFFPVDPGSHNRVQSDL